MPSPTAPLSLIDPSNLPPFSKAGDLHVVETPRGSRNKYAFDHDRHILLLRKILPAGLVFPFDFGFVPSTRADDGDPLDILLLMEEPAFPGCVVEARAIGVLEGEDHPVSGATNRNDRVLAVATRSHSYAAVNDISDLPGQLIESLKQFFETYPRLLGEKLYTVLGVKGAEVARTLIRHSRQLD